MMTETDLTEAAERLTAGITKTETEHGVYYERVDTPTQFALMEPYELAVAYLADPDIKQQRDALLAACRKALIRNSMFSGSRFADVSDILNEAIELTEQKGTA